jgi:hypothetical protein
MRGCLGSLHVESVARFALGGVCRKSSAGLHFSHTWLVGGATPYLWIRTDRLHDCEPLVEGPEEGKEILGSLQSALGREKFKYIELRPLSANLLAETGLQKNNSFCFHALDLHPELGELFGRLQKDSIQRKIRRAEREALFYEEGRSDTLLNKFYHLFVQTRRRHRVPPQPVNWFRNVVTCLGDRVKIRVASKAGRPIASIVTLRHGNTMVYKYGGSDASAHNLGAMPFLFWNAKKDGVQKFDFGRSDCDNAGLITFKDRWGSRRTELTYWRSPGRSADGREQWKLKVAGPIFACMPDLFLAASGRILYRHLG